MNIGQDSHTVQKAGFVDHLEYDSQPELSGVAVGDAMVGDADLCKTLCTMLPQSQ